MRSVGRERQHICVLSLPFVLGPIRCCVLKPSQDSELPTRGRMGGTREDRKRQMVTWKLRVEVGRWSGVCKLSGPWQGPQKAAAAPSAAPQGSDGTIINPSVDFPWNTQD